jgi:hypothetical protein
MQTHVCTLCEIGFKSDDPILPNDLCPNCKATPQRTVGQSLGLLFASILLVGIALTPMILLKFAAGREIMHLIVNLSCAGLGLHFSFVINRYLSKHARSDWSSTAASLIVGFSLPIIALFLIKVS